MKRISIVIFCIVCMSAVSSAQYWHRLPSIEQDKSASISVSNDDKRVFYISGNTVSSVDLKGGAPIEVVSSPDAPIVRAIHAVSKPYIIYMKAAPGSQADYHIYRDASTGGAALDVTPTGVGAANIIIGEAFNGRYIYYTSNQTNRSKIDVYRYDINQNISELIFANDKNYEVIAWSRDANRLLYQDPVTTQIWNYDINTTTRNQLYVPVTGKKVKQAMLSADGKTLYILVTEGSISELRSMKMASPSETGDEVVPLESGVDGIDLSMNGKYLLTRKDGKTHIKDIAAGYTEILSGVFDGVNFNAKETFIITSRTSPEGKVIEMYDIAKKTTTLLTTIK